MCKYATKIIQFANVLVRFYLSTTTTIVQTWYEWYDYEDKDDDEDGE